jgi:iron complex transport system substrate-binding protein
MKISLRRLVCFVLLGLFAVTLIAACNTANNLRLTSQRSQDDNCRIVQHSMGETCVPQHPQRIVVLDEGVVINCLQLGFSPIASVYEPGDSLPNYLQGKVRRVESVGGYGTPNIEKILYLQPDLILADSYYSEKLYAQLSQIAPTVVLNRPYPLPPWKEQLAELAQVLDKEDVAQQLMNNYWQRIEQLKQALGDRRHTLQVSVASTGAQYGIWAYGENYFSGTVLSDIGLQRPPTQKGNIYIVENTSEEMLSNIEGDVLFFLAWDSKDDQKTLEKLKQKPLWQQLEVIQRNRAYFVGEHWHHADLLAIHAILDDLFKYLIDVP